MACHYITLNNIITYYVTIITLIAIMAINTLLCHIYDYFQKAKSAFSEQKNAGMDNTPRVSCWRRIPAAWSPRSVNDMDLWFLGSAHGVPNDCVCDECPWHAVNQTRSYSGRIWSPMIWATFSDRRVSLFPHLFLHHDACCDSTLTCCKFPSVAQSMPMAPKLALNTIQKEAYTQPCA